MLKKLFLKCRRLLTYGAVGCANTAIDWCVFTVCTELLHASPPLGHALGYVCGMTSNYILNRVYTFRDGDGGSLKRQLPLFIAISLLSLGVSTLVVWLLTRWGVNKYVAKVVSMALSTTINYLGIKTIVFRIYNKKEDQRDE